MRVIGHGIDIVELSAIRRLRGRDEGHFLDECFTAAERDALPTGLVRDAHVAGRFAAKEAVLKALGLGLSGGVSMTEIEIVSAPSGAPVMRFAGEALRTAVAGGLTRYETSITHDAGLAAAVVMLS